MMTEKNARKKWCPFSQTSSLEECTMGVATYTFNRDPRGLPDECLCVASDCMAWEWGDEDDFQDACGKASAAGGALPKPVGDCGLKRGKP